MSATDPNDTTTLAESVAAPVADVAPTYSPEYVAQLENYYRTTQPVFEEIQSADPDDVLDYVRNKDRRDFSKKSWEFYQKGAENENQLSPELLALEERLTKKLMPLVEKPAQFVDQLNAQQMREQQAQNANIANANWQYFERIKNESVFKEDPKKLEKVIRYGVANNLTLEAAHKDLYASSVSDPEPTTTRSQDGEAGIPKKPNRTRERYSNDLHGSLVSDITSALRNSRA